MTALYINVKIVGVDGITILFIINNSIKQFVSIDFSINLGIHILSKYICTVFAYLAIWKLSIIDCCVQERVYIIASNGLTISVLTLANNFCILKLLPLRKF